EYYCCLYYSGVWIF
nr:immunoglobulin light chain junction region [Macaca mulatta]